MKTNIDIWFDFVNPPHVNLFLPILRYYQKKGLKIFCTAKEFVETTGLLKKNNIPYQSFGHYGGGSRLSKLKNLLSRNIQLLKNIPRFKVCISSSFEAAQISWLSRRPAIFFDDNETAPNWLYAKFVKHVIAPSVIDKSLWEKDGISAKKIIQYHGYKEDMSIAAYQPDPEFSSCLPFNQFVTVRPENIQASYVPKNTKSIVPELVKELVKKGYNVLYLPRYEMDRAYVKIHPQIFSPKFPLDGLDVCFYSTAVLTGAGTFAREAALMGIPSVSFFSGKRLLSVDRSLIEKKEMFYSRNINEILGYLTAAKKREFNPEPSKKVQQEIFCILDRIIEKYV